MAIKYTSLGEFERRHGVNKGSVSKRAREKGYDTASGLSPLAYEAMCREFNVQPWINGRPASGEAPAQAVASEVIPETFFRSGQLTPVKERQIQLPDGFNPTAMVQFFDGVAGQATDTATLVKIADMALQSVEGAMDQKLHDQRQRLSQAEKDAQTLATQINGAKTRLQVKALEAKMLAERQTQATVSAEELFAELMTMGKPQNDAPVDGSTSA
ncbi:MAG: hypothetical protein ACFB0C_20305 [Leptolyngbyaceae cyanobacterium]